jgi:NitT/TauT family transport system substrate-binding protein
MKGFQVSVFAARNVAAFLFTLTLGSSAAMAAEKVSIALGWIPGGERTHYYVARARGFFAEEGLDVSILAGKGATDAITKVASGNADFAEAGFESLLIAKARGDMPLTGVMVVMSKMPDALIVTAGSGIKSLADMAGKKVATSPFTSSNGPWPYLLKNNGIDPDKVQLLKVDAAALTPMLAAGQVDGIIQFVTNLPLTESALNSVGKKAETLAWSDYGLKGYSVSLMASNKTIATRRDMVVKVVRAIRRGMEAVRQDPHRAAEDLKASIPEADVALTEAVVRASLPVMFNEVSDRDGLGVFSPEILQAMWKRVSTEQNIPIEKLDPTTTVDFSLAK